MIKSGIDKAGRHYMICPKCGAKIVEEGVLKAKVPMRLFIKDCKLHNKNKKVKK